MLYFFFTFSRICVTICTKYAEAQDANQGHISDALREVTPKSPRASLKGDTTCSDTVKCSKKEKSFAHILGLEK